jgi:hypothetical protein
MVYDDSLASLRHAVNRKLPSYMAPATYVVLNRFSLMTPGTLDRTALDQRYYMHKNVLRDVETDADQDATDPAASKNELEMIGSLTVPQGKASRN